MAEKKKSGRFKPGESGNPSGRPKVPKEVKELLKARSVDAVNFIVSTMQDEKAKQDLRVKCAEIIIERAYGKATQIVDVDSNSKICITLDDRLAEYAE